VCIARDLEYNQLVALRVMPRAATAGPDAEEAFRRAAAVAAGLDHPHIVPLYSAGATDRFFWCAMQYVEGRSLAEGLRSSGPIEPAACLGIAGQVATALDFAHRLGVIHAGLTPGNVLLDAAGDAHVTDFWIPWVLEGLGALPDDGGKAQRARYRAPEQLAEGRCGPEADQHALATLMKACLMKTRAPIAPEIGRAIERALSPAPENRFPSVREFAVALGAAGAPSSARTPALIGYDGEGYQEDAPSPSRWSWVPAGAFTLIVLGAVAAPWLLSRGSTGNQTSGSASQYTPPPDDLLALLQNQPALSDGSVDSIVPAPPPPSRALAAPAAPAAPTARARVKKAPQPLAVPGRLFINATPWGQVYVDGGPLGNTPLVNVPVSPGAHRLRVVHDGFQPYEVAIHVQSGQELRMTDIVLQELKP
jgi:serine/threonine-protein kinase